MDHQNASASAQKNLGIEELNEASDARITALRVEGMDCINCAVRVRDALTVLDGVVSADVDWEQGLAIVDYIPTQTNVDALVRAVASASDDQGRPGDGRHNYRAQIIGSKENV